MTFNPRERANSLLPKSVYKNLPTPTEPRIFQELPRFKSRDREIKLFQLDQILLRLLIKSYDRFNENWLYDIRNVAKHLTDIFYKPISAVEVYDAQVPITALNFNGYNFWLDLKEGTLFYQSIKSKLMEKGYIANPSSNGHQ